MSKITVQWHDEHKQILHFTFGKTVDWDNYSKSVEQMLQMIKAVEYPVVEIMDVTAVDGLPNNIFSEGRRSMSQDPNPHILAVIIVGVNPYLNAALTMFQKVMPKRIMEQWNMIFVNTLDEALNLAQELLAEAANDEAKIG